MADAGERERAVEVHDAPPAESAERVPQALLWGLRRPRDETQLTQASAEVARVDKRFAGAFVALLLNAAANGSQSANVQPLLDGGVPPELGCRAEQHLRDTGDVSLGRVDLRFDGDDFTLFVENKLYSGYGNDQVKRYLAALERLPEERRSGLVAVTRNVPTYGEPKLEGQAGWLGSVRWAHIRACLRELPVHDDQLAAQWKLFVDVLEQQGDLGMTGAQPDLIRAWAQYLKGREHLADILDQVQERALDVVERELERKYGRRAKGEPLVAPYTRGKKHLVVQRDQVSVYLGFRIPAKVKDSALEIQFNGYFGVPPSPCKRSPGKHASCLTMKTVRFSKLQVPRGRRLPKQRALLGEGPRPKRLHRRRRCARPPHRDHRARRSDPRFQRHPRPRRRGDAG
jgi:hypothetical protein